MKTYNTLKEFNSNLNLFSDRTEAKFEKLFNK